MGKKIFNPLKLLENVQRITKFSLEDRKQVYHNFTQSKDDLKDMVFDDFKLLPLQTLDKIIKQASEDQRNQIPNAGSLRDLAARAYNEKIIISHLNKLIEKIDNLSQPNKSLDSQDVSTLARGNYNMIAAAFDTYKKDGNITDFKKVAADHLSPEGYNTARSGIWNQLIQHSPAKLVSHIADLREWLGFKTKTTTAMQKFKDSLSDLKSEHLEVSAQKDVSNPANPSKP